MNEILRQMSVTELRACDRLYEHFCREMREHQSLVTIEVAQAFYTAFHSERTARQRTKGGVTS